jgi:hypothetical protein
MPWMTRACIGSRSLSSTTTPGDPGQSVTFPSNAGTPWTKDNIRELKTLARQKMPVAKIAKSLKRTLRATQQKAYSIGVSLNSRG